MDSKQILDAVADVMRERFAELERIVAAARIKSIEHGGPGRVLVVLGDGTTFPFLLAPGPPGPPGQRGDEGERGEQGAPGFMGARGEQGEQGERGAQGVAGVGIESVEQGEGEPAFTLRLSDGSAVDVELPEGPRGERGERGMDGADRFVIAPRRVRDGDAVAKNDLVYHAGGIMQAIRATTRSPADDPASYQPIINGIDAVRISENLATRTYDITARLTDGTEVVERVASLPRFMLRGPRPGERVIKGDQFIRGDWLFTATVDDPPEPISGAFKSPGWSGHNLRGKPGERGPQGDRGADGVGLADVGVVDGVIALKLTNGEEKFLPLAAE